MTPSISVGCDLEQGKRAEHVWNVYGRGGVQIRAVEIGEGRGAQQAETTLHLVLEQLEQAHDPALPAARECKALHAADADQIRAGRDRLDDVGAAADRAVDDDFGAAAGGVDDLGQYVERAAAVVELPPAMIRHVDPINPVLDRDRSVLGGGDALDRERNLELRLDALDRAPVEARLRDAILHPAPAGGNEAF